MITICRALGCPNHAMPNGPLCGRCDELAEDGPIPMKRTLSPAIVAQRIETRRKNHEANMDAVEARVKARRMAQEVKR